MSDTAGLILLADRLAPFGPARAECAPAPQPIPPG